VLVETFVAEPSVEAFDESVLLWLAWGDIVLKHASFSLPSQDRMRRQRGAVVADDHHRPAPHRYDLVEFASDTNSAQRRVDDQGKTFAGEIVDHCQPTEPSPVVEGVRYEVERPALVGRCGSAIGERVPSGRLRPPRLRTLSFSARYRGNSFLWFS
jgi:hypothetical protein